MSISVFVSSTGEDLKNDCRPWAIGAVAHAAATPVTMEGWDTDYLDPVQVCEGKVRDSSHFLGIIAYRRGWEPPTLGRSITEAEFDWAFGTYRKPSAVLIPDAGSEFARELRVRASGQSDEERARQELFLQKVQRSGTYMPFTHPGDLVSKVTLKVAFWVMGGGLLGAARRAHEARASAPAPGTGVDFHRAVLLGRAKHCNRFSAVWESAAADGLRPAACFVVHGPDGSGHDELVQRLLRVLPASAAAVEARHEVAEVDVVWQQKTAAALAGLVGARVGRGDHEALGARLGRLLEVSDVVLEVGNVQRLDGSLSAFVRDFWRPLLRDLPAWFPNRLVVFARHESPLPDPRTPDVAEFLQDDPDPFDPARAVCLPALAPFTPAEIRGWLRTTRAVPEAQVDAVADAFFQETQGAPDRLYKRLKRLETTP